MAILWIILAVTIALSVRAGIYRRRWNPADSESDARGGDDWLIDNCARTFILVLLSLLGLLYGNVLGAVPVAT